MEPEMMKKMEEVKSNLQGGKFVGKAILAQSEMEYKPCDDSCEDSGSRPCREGASFMVKRIVKQKSERVAAFQQLNDLFDAGHIKDGSPLESLIYEWLGRERRY